MMIVIVAGNQYAQSIPFHIKKIIGVVYVLVKQWTTKEVKMITSRAGKEVIILHGTRANVTGKGHFTVKFPDSSLPRHVAYGKITKQKGFGYWNKPFKLRKDELLFENDQELYDAISKNKVKS